MPGSRREHGDLKMQMEGKDLSAVRARAKKRFQDYDVEFVYPVYLPVYELRLRVLEQEVGKLSTAARFVLMLTSVPVTEVPQIQRYLGLSEADMVITAAELLSASLIVQQPDQRINITELGHAVLREAGRTYRPRNRHPRVPYDPLVRAVVGIELDELLDREEVRKQGLYVPPTKPRRPRLSQIRLPEVQEYEERLGKARNKAEILQVSDIKDIRLRYRADVILVKLLHRQSHAELYVAYRAQQYLDLETEAIQRLAATGVDLVPEDIRPAVSNLDASVSRMSPEEGVVVGDIDKLEKALGETDVAVAEAEASRTSTQDERERGEHEETIRELTAQRCELESKLRCREKELEELSRGEARVVKTEEHRPLLLEAVKTATSQLTIASAWINSRTLDDELCKALAAAVRRGVTVRIVWGMGTRGREPQRNRTKGEAALGELKRRIPEEHGGKLIIKRIETHEKFVICDDKFCVSGSFNWLSYRGEMDSEYRRETSLYSERKAVIEAWKANAETLFA